MFMFFLYWNSIRIRHFEGMHSAVLNQLKEGGTSARFFNFISFIISKRSLYFEGEDSPPRNCWVGGHTLLNRDLQESRKKFQTRLKSFNLLMIFFYILRFKTYSFDKCPRTCNENKSGLLPTWLIIWQWLKPIWNKLFYFIQNFIASDVT